VRRHRVGASTERRARRVDVAPVRLARRQDRRRSPIVWGFLWCTLLAGDVVAGTPSGAGRPLILPARPGDASTTEAWLVPCSGGERVAPLRHRANSRGTRLELREPLPVGDWRLEFGPPGSFRSSTWNPGPWFSWVHSDGTRAVVRRALRAHCVLQAFGLTLDHAESRWLIEAVWDRAIVESPAGPSPKQEVVGVSGVEWPPDTELICGTELLRIGETRTGTPPRIDVSVRNSDGSVETVRLRAVPGAMRVPQRLRAGPPASR
jgi:hypothetical protein